VLRRDENAGFTIDISDGGGVDWHAAKMLSPSQCPICGIQGNDLAGLKIMLDGSIAVPYPDNKRRNFAVIDYRWRRHNAPSLGKRPGHGFVSPYLLTGGGVEPVDRTILGSDENQRPIINQG